MSRVEGLAARSNKTGKERMAFAFTSPYHPARQRGCQCLARRLVYRGLVLGARLAAVFFVPAPPTVFRFAVFFLVTCDFVCDPEVTRLECFARALVAFFGAASAVELSANAATSATSRILIFLRI